MGSLAFASGECVAFKKYIGAPRKWTLVFSGTPANARPARLLLLVQIGTLMLTCGAIRALHLSSTGWLAQSLSAAEAFGLGGLWMFFSVTPRKPNNVDARLALACLALILGVSYTFVGLFAQYPAVALGRPYSDGWLAAADAAIGVDVSRLAAWTHARPLIERGLVAAYGTFVPQCAITLVGLALLDDREGLWEFLTHVHVCLLVVLICLALWPAVSPPAHYGFTAPVPMLRIIDQVRGFHEGRLRVIHVEQFDGLVSFPSFHVAIALWVPWAWRRHRRAWIPLAVLNVVVIAATVWTGVHYLTDVLGAGVMCAGSVAAYARLASAARSPIAVRNAAVSEL